MTIFDNIANLLAFKKKKVGLALGGGIARGIAHIGVIKILKKHKVPISFVAGCSAGSIIGALFASGMDPHLMEKAAHRLGWARFIRFVMARHGPATTDEIQKFISTNIGDIQFSGLKYPFAAVATDLKTGREVIIRDGPVCKGVAASSAFPGVFVPLRRGHDLLVDGGIANNLPVSVAKKMGADFVIAVDVVPANPLKNDLNNALEIFGRAFDLVMKKISSDGRNLADIVIEPDIPEDIWHLDFDKSKRLIAAGEEAAESRILEIKTRLAL
ncbi:patatin-like phospholipase family protein [Candidatus Saganbacteria bacterium]|nr:patatin-like phospholipase family protein [Candidatus Saganbacteria bacterium]